MNPTYPLFQVIRRGPRANKTIRIPSNFGAQPVGVALIESATPNPDQDDSGGCALADGTAPFIGFITRAIVTTTPVPTFSELATAGDAPNIPFETAFLVGDEGSTEDADEYEAEGIGYLAIGPSANGTDTTQDLGTNPAVGTMCSFLKGLTCKAKTGQWAEYQVAEVEANPSVAGNVRIRFRRVLGRVM